MNASEFQTMERTLTPKEIALLVRSVRESRGWTQEVLAEMTGLTVRTIQRIESGEGASIHSLRGLARAFGMEDIDGLSKSHSIPTESELRAQKEKFEAENIILELHPLKTGRALANVAGTVHMDMAMPIGEPGPDAERVFAELTDYYREYRDASELYTEVQKIDVYEDLQRHLDCLVALGFTLGYATRRVQLTFESDASGQKPAPMLILYLVLAPTKELPTKIAVTRKIQFG